MSMPTRLNGLGIYPATVIAQENAQPPPKVLDLRFNPGGFRVTEGVDQCLSTDQVNLLLNRNLQFFRLSQDKHLETHVGGGELFPQAEKPTLEGHRRHRR